MVYVDRRELKERRAFEKRQEERTAGEMREKERFYYEKEKEKLREMAKK